MQSVSPNIAAPPKPGLFINRNFGLLWSGQAISNLGDVVFGTTLVLWLGAILGSGQSWAPLAVSGVLLAECVPPLIAGPLAGVFVDRWDKRRTMLWADGSRALLIFILVILSGGVWLPIVPGGQLPLPWQIGAIFLLTALEATCAQFFGPARLALIGDIVEEEWQARASGMSQAMVDLAVVIGPSLAAPLVLGVGPAWGLAIDAVSFLVSYLTIMAIHAPGRQTMDDGRWAMDSRPSSAVYRPSSIVKARAHGSVKAEFMDGLRTLFGSAGLRSLLLCQVASSACFGAINTLAVFFVTENLHLPSTLFGVMATVIGTGAIVGAIVIGATGERLGIGRTLWMSTSLLGLIVVLFSRLTDAGPAFVGAAIIGAAYAVTSTVVGPLVLRLTPREYVGRVTSVLTPLGSAAQVATVVVAGALTSTVLYGMQIQLLGFTFGGVDTCLSVIGALVALVGLAAAGGLRKVRSET